MTRTRKFAKLQLKELKDEMIGVRYSWLGEATRKPRTRARRKDRRPHGFVEESL